jgi:hypothetical protein
MDTVSNKGNENTSLRMKHMKEYTDYILNLELSNLDRSKIDSWLDQNEKAYQFSGDVQLDQSLDSIVQNLMQELNFPADKKDEITSYVSDRMAIKDDEAFPMLIMSPNAMLKYSDFVDGLSRYEIN